MSRLKKLGKKAISLSLIASICVTQVSASLISDGFETTGSRTSSSWKDVRTGITYHSGPAKTFAFKKSTSFAPWFKGEEPSIKAGCNGVSLDGGFVGYLDLEEIAKQLEQALASAGMGVIVVLVQTLPSIGKAFDDIQKLVRKIQSMLQNACQLAMSAMKGNQHLKDAHDSMQSKVDSLLGPESLMGDAMQGATAKLEEFEKYLTCEGGDKACIKDSFKSFYGILPKTDNGASGQEKNDITSSNGGKKVLAKIKDAFEDSNKLVIGSFSEVVNDDKIAGKALSLDESDKTFLILKEILYGHISMNGSVCFGGYIGTDGSLKPEPLAKKIAGGEIFKCSYEVVKPAETKTEVLDFLVAETGSLDEEKEIKINDFEIKGFSFATESSKENSDQGVKYVYSWNEDKDPKATATIKWKGLYSRSYNVILKRLNSQVATDDIGIFLPNGGNLLNTVKRNVKKVNYEHYARQLARLNVYFAIDGIIDSINKDMASLPIAVADRSVVYAYTQLVKERSKEIKIELDKYVADVKKVNILNEYFDRIKRIRDK